MAVSVKLPFSTVRLASDASEMSRSAVRVIIPAPLTVKSDAAVPKLRESPFTVRF